MNDQELIRAFREPRRRGEAQRFIYENWKEYYEKWMDNLEAVTPDPSNINRKEVVAAAIISFAERVNRFDFNPKFLFANFGRDLRFAWFNACSDSQIIQLLINNEAQSDVIEWTFEAWMPYMRSVIYKKLGRWMQDEELRQVMENVMIVVIGVIDTGRGITNVKAYVAKSVFRQILKDSDRGRFVELEDKKIPANKDTLSEIFKYFNIENIDFENDFKKLSLIEKQLLLLVYVGFSYEEIGEQLDLSVEEVRRILFNCRQRLRRSC